MIGVTIGIARMTATETNGNKAGNTSSGIEWRDISPKRATQEMLPGTRAKPRRYPDPLECDPAAERAPYKLHPSQPCSQNCVRERDIVRSNLVRTYTKQLPTAPCVLHRFPGAPRENCEIFPQKSGLIGWPKGIRCEKNLDSWAEALTRAGLEVKYQDVLEGFRYH
jgi:hypothetical protein